MKNTLEAVLLTRCALYTRYSAQMQRPASLEDQERSCRDLATINGWQVLDQHIYKDAAVSGTSRINRTGLEYLMAAAESSVRSFDYVLIDDTSRLSRDLSDVLTLTKTLKHNGIGVYFVSQKLDSRDDNFKIMLMVFGMADEQYIDRLKTKVHSGQKGRILQGFSSGSRCYGYRSVVEVCTDRIYGTGRSSTTGTRWEVIPEEAAVIRRIYDMFSDGSSVFQICTTLNTEKVLSARKPRYGTQDSSWNPNLVKRILQNDKYRGVIIWNRTTQVRHPKTGKITIRKKPEQAHITVAAPHLRIVTDLQWDAVFERKKFFSEKNQARVLGGLNRAKKKDYLYSGLLYCGQCGSKLRIAGGKDVESAYECPNHRYRRGCTNKLRMREDRLAGQLTDALANHLLLPDHLTYLSLAVTKELNEALKLRRQVDPHCARQMLVDARTACSQKINRLIHAIENTDSDGLLERLTGCEVEMKQIDARLRVLCSPARSEIGEQEIEQLLKKSVANLLAVLRSDVPLARKVLQNHVKRLVLFPGADEKGPLFEVVGEMDLFNNSNDPEASVLLDCWSTPTVQQHTDRSFNFCYTLYLKLDIVSPIVGPLCELLESRPELMLKPRTAKGWAQLLREVFAEDAGMQRLLSGHYVAWCFRAHHHLLAEKLNVAKTVNSHTGATLYQLSERTSESPAETKTVAV